MNLIAKDVYGNDHEVTRDEIVWRPSVYGIVIRDGHILVSPQHGIGYDLPGGGPDIDESLEEAVIREVKEETGIDVSVTRFLMAGDNLFVWEPTNSAKRKVYHSVLCYYECRYVGGELSTSGFDAHEQQYAEIAQWIQLDDALTMPIASSYDFRPILASLR